MGEAGVLHKIKTKKYINDLVLMCTQKYDATSTAKHDFSAEVVCMYSSHNKWIYSESSE